MSVPLGSYNDIDLLPPGATVQSASVSWLIGNNKQYDWQTIPSVGLDLDGVPLGPAQIVSNLNWCLYSTGAVTYVFPGSYFAGGLPGYLYGQEHSVTMTLSNGTINVSGFAVLTLTYVPPPAPISFSVTGAASETERRVLLSNLHSGYPYPKYQGLGGRDSAVPMFLGARGSAGQYQSGLTVYLRVTDPPDPAAYMNLPGNTLARDGDNTEPKATLKILDAQGIPLVPDGAGAYQTVSGANGVIYFTLELPPGTAAGNNYQVEASFDKTFPAGASYKSGTLTAWKRIFVEKRRMLRNGMLITQPAAAGSNTIQVHGNAYGGNMARRDVLSRGDRIVMVHSPQLDRSDALGGWYLETHTIDTAEALTDGSGDYKISFGTRQGKTLTPEYLAHPFDKDNQDSLVGDGIARLTGSILSPDDYFDTDDTLLSQFDSSGKPASAFSQAFVEYYVLPDNVLPGGTPVPVPRVLTYNPDVFQHLADRWSSSVSWNGTGNSAVSNHQLLLIGDNDGFPTPQAVGATTKKSERASVVYRGTIDAQVRQVGLPYTGVDPAKYAAKVEAHELTHQWSVDNMWPTSVGNFDGHCPNDSTMFDDASSYCLMARGDANMSEKQVGNMVAKFHLTLGPTGAWNSEYFEIRMRADPFVP